jgi:hypothetical protein
MQQHALRGPLGARGGGPAVVEEKGRPASSSFCTLRGQQSFAIHSSEFSINSTGRTAVVADAQGLCAVGLYETPFPQHRILHDSRWPAATLECCRHPAFPQRVATSSRCNILIWDISAETAPLVEVIRHHQMPVTALEWAHGRGDILASAAVRRGRWSPL